MVTATALAQNTQITFEVRLQTVLEHYLRGLRERIPAMIELKGALPCDFWAQEEKALAAALGRLAGDRAGLDDLAQRVISRTAPRVDELLAMESQREISLDMLRYELRIGPLSDARAEKMAIQGMNIEIFKNSSAKPHFSPDLREKMGGIKHFKPSF